MAVRRGDKREGEVLVRDAIISQGELDAAHESEARTGTPWYRQLLQSKKLPFGALNDILLYEFHSSADRETHETLGERLIKMKALTRDQLNEALSLQKRNGKLLGTILQENKFVTPEDIGRAIARQHSLKFIESGDAPSDQEALEFVPESMAKQKAFVPVSIENDRLKVLISGPQSPDRLKHVGVMLGCRVDPIVSAIGDMDAEIAERYKGNAAGLQRAALPDASRVPEPVLPKAVEQAPVRPIASAPKPTIEERRPVANQEKQRFEEIAKEAVGAPVVKLVSTIIEGAVNSGATDIHLDPQEPEMRVRYRIDGVLHDVMSIPEEIEAAIVSRLKIMSDIDITETRHPQDGHISMSINDSEFDIRVATLPTYLGERVVLRLLDQTSVLQGVKDLGLEEDDQKRLLRIIDAPYGMILVTGPTGSGKTTTLYSCLNQKNVMTDSIVTLEDPVEYQLSGINQVQIDPDIQLTFANVLRASLRQDIDVLLVGEIRDPETARIAIRAAMTGHLVFSTLHTNDAPEAIATLRNMSVPSYLISSALTAVVGQRLVRKICDNCREKFVPSKALLKSIKLPETTKTLYRGKGCELCYRMGTRGRTGIFEVVEITPPIRTLIAEDAPPAKITSAAKLKTMADRCRVKVKKGEINPEEFLRVIRT